MNALHVALPPVREDLRDFAGYRSARSERVSGTVWLDANESAWRSGADEDGSLRRYPEPQPEALTQALSDLYGCERRQLLVGRGSDEPIDLLVRAFCAASRDAVLVTPPVFGMYAVCARLQGARLVEVPLVDGAGDFRADLDAVAEAALSSSARLVFLCSPGNPAGGMLAAAAVLALAHELAGRALVVVDEAYVEFADAPSLVPSITDQPNLAVLRTLSKAHALAAARIGCVIADPDVIAVLRRCQAPYPVPAPSAQRALRALATDSLRQTRERTERTREERERMRVAIAELPGVRRVYPSQTNFLLVRLDEPAVGFERLLDAGVVVRDMRAMPQLGDALRISLGTPTQNDRVLSALTSSAVTVPALEISS